jgi:hydrogenase-1 operon protein HyaF
VSHVVNLTLLPVTPEDIGFLDHHLGTGRVLMLSRGYGNCRISNTRLPNCWRVVYYNSMDKVILNTVEVVDMPEVAMAAPEDLRDSHERLADVMNYLEGV